MASDDTGVDAKTLAGLTEALLPHVGAFAHPMVRRTARECANIAELIDRLAMKVENPEQRAEFLKSARRIAGNSRAGSGSARVGPRPDQRPAAPPLPTRFSAETLEPIRAALAEYVGPVAALLIERAVERAQSREQLVNMLSAEIPANEERLAFLKRVNPG